MATFDISNYISTSKKYKFLISTMTSSLAEIKFLISGIKFQLVKIIILDIKNLNPGYGNRQAVLTVIHSQDMNS